jgi:outer membrane protein OmpA-like peptidoglycan-associated protein
MKRTPSMPRPDRTPGTPAPRVSPAASDGQALSPSLRQRMQDAMGHDFSSVRVHADAGGAAFAHSLGARAVTQGSHIAFAPGHYRPESREGISLLAHELAHVAQPKPSRVAGVAPHDHASEREADRVADVVADGGRAVPREPAGGALQRDPLPGMETLPPLRGGDALLDDASPMLASLMGSTTLEGFDAGSGVLSAEHRTALASTARNINALLGQYPMSAVRITGYADGAALTLDDAALAHGRANAASAVLIAAGVPASIIAASGSNDAAPDGKGRVEVRFEPKRLFSISMLPKADFGLRPSLALPGTPGASTGAGGFSMGAYGLGLGPSGFKPPVPLLPPGPLGPRLPPSSMLLPPGPGSSPQSAGSGLPSLDLDLTIGPVTVKLPKEIKAKLPLPLGNAKRLVFDLDYEAPAKFGLKITLDGTPHVTVSLKGGAEYDVKKGQSTASGGLVIESNRKVCIAEDSETLRQKVKTAGEKLNKAVKEFGEATTFDDRMSKGTEIAGAIGEIYGAVEKSKAGCSEAPSWTLEFGYKRLLDPGKETDPSKWPARDYFGLTWTWRFGGKKK